MEKVLANRHPYAQQTPDTHNSHWKPIKYVVMPSILDETHERRVELALVALKSSNTPSTNVAPAKFHCSRYRIMRRLKGIGTKSNRQAHGYKLSETQESAVLLYIKRLEGMSINLQYSMLKPCVDSILRDANGSEISVPPEVGGRWTARFINRQRINIKKTQPNEIERQMAHDPANIEVWFNKYRRKSENNRIQDADVWNMDETGFRIGIGRGDKVLALKQGKVFVPSETNRDYTTAVEAVSGLGKSIPPMIILKGWEHLARWYTEEVGFEKDVLIALSDSGYTNDELHLQWIHHFHRHSLRSQRGIWRLLLMDGFDSHCTRPFLEACDNFDIIPFLLPAHSSHFLQPLDVGVFQPYKHWYTQTVNKATRDGSGDFNKVEFLHALKEVRPKAMKVNTIRGGFRRCGLIPYNPDLVLDELRNRQAAFHAPLPGLDSDGEI